MADLKALIRLRRHRIEEKQKFLADLYRQAEDIEAQQRTLRDTLEKERAIAESDAGFAHEYFGLYAEGVKKKIDKLQKDLSKLNVRIQIAQDEIREAFGALKQVEIVQKNREREEREEEDAKESRDLDEIGLETFRRKEN